MQITPPTAQRPRVVSKIGYVPTIRDLNTPARAIQIAAAILWELQTYYFRGDLVGEIKAYNGGPGWKSNVAKNPALAATLDSYFVRVNDFYSRVLDSQPTLA